MNLKPQHNNLVHSYLSLRKAVGWIGILLPFALMAGANFIFDGNVILRSISHYYYSGMRDVFVGGVCAIALFLFFYRGYDNWGKINWDNLLSSLAGLFAIGIAIFPTTETGSASLSGIVHLICACAFFVILAAFSLFIFTKKGPSPTDEKNIRNQIYVACGLTMAVCMIAIAVFMNFGDGSLSGSSFVFWAEALALVAFGISWLTKGGSLYPDQKQLKK